MNRFGHVWTSVDKDYQFEKLNKQITKMKKVTNTTSKKFDNSQTKKKVASRSVSRRLAHAKKIKSFFFQPLYPSSVCNCHLDLCLSTVFDYNTKCPNCAEYEEPITTTPFDWSILFQGDPATEEPKTIKVQTIVTTILPNGSTSNVETEQTTTSKIQGKSVFWLDLRYSNGGIKHDDSTKVKKYLRRQKVSRVSL